MEKILLGPSSFAQLDASPRRLLERKGYGIVDNPFRRRLTAEEVSRLLAPDVVGLIAGLEPLNRAVLSKSNLRVISRVGAGLSNVDIDAAEEQGIKVFYTPYGPTTAVAELTLAILLSLLRQVPQMDRALHQGNWDKRVGRQLEGKTVAIVGFGRIGRKFASLLEPFTTEILIVDPFLDAAYSVHCHVTLEEALDRSDILSFHLSGSDRLIGHSEFNRMKKGVFILNAARGGVVDEMALADALTSGIVAGAWLDTFEQEPYNGPLKEFDSVILTPHVGSYTLEGRKQMEMDAVNHLLEGLSSGAGSLSDP